MVRAMSLVLVLAMLVCSGCIGGLLEKLPDHEFTKFDYNRAGNVTSASITAINCKTVDGKLSTESVVIKENWGPAVNFTLTIEGYTRDINESENE